MSYITPSDFYEKYNIRYDRLIMKCNKIKSVDKSVLWHIQDYMYTNDIDTYQETLDNISNKMNETRKTIKSSFDRLVSQGYILKEKLNSKIIKYRICDDLSLYQNSEIKKNECKNYPNINVNFTLIKNQKKQSNNKYSKANQEKNKTVSSFYVYNNINNINTYKEEKHLNFRSSNDDDKRVEELRDLLKISKERIEMLFSQCLSEKAKDLTTKYIRYQIEVRKVTPRDPYRYLQSTLLHIFEYDLSEFNEHKEKEEYKEYVNFIDYAKKEFRDIHDEYYEQAYEKAVNKFLEKNPGFDPKEPMADLLIRKATETYLIQLLEKNSEITKKFSQKA